MRTKEKERFITVRSEGGLLPSDFLEKISTLDADVDGLRPEHFHLFERGKINEAINRAWERLLGCWISFKAAIKDSPPDDPLTKETRDRWLLPLFESFGYGRLASSKPVELEGKSFPISHIWQSVPIHLVGWGVDLDRRTSGVAGASKSAPHGLVQDFLNRSDNHLWAFVSNGRRLRILRDNVSLTRQAYVEFDLEGMMDGELFSDFRVLWLLCHESRVEAERPELCWLEIWSKAAQETGIRVRDQLRAGVERALGVLGTGFLQHPSNTNLRERIRRGELSSQEYYRQLLRIIYRLLFLFVAEDRDLLLLPDESKEHRDAYKNFYSTQRLRDIAGARKGSQHTDSWQSLQVVFDVIGRVKGCRSLALPGLGSFLWQQQAIADLRDCLVTNRTIFECIRALAFTEGGNTRRTVDFKNLRSEELGSIYEALLEMHPHVDVVRSDFSLMGASGSERRTTGSYYTPTSLVNCVLDTTLGPMIESVAHKTNAKTELLTIKVCDPACGSGHFLIAAAHRLARSLAAARAEDTEPSPEGYRLALRDVIAHCIFGVDVNEMSVELCKVSLWLESLDPGKPLSFLDDKIKCGNSLFGVIPKLSITDILPESFDPLEGDDKAVAKNFKAANKQQSPGQLTFDTSNEVNALASLHSAAMRLDEMSDSTVEQIHQKEAAFSALLRTESYTRQRFICDAWCASFVWRLAPSAPPPITRDVFGRIRRNESVPAEITTEVARLREQYKFFHWHIEFPQVFLENSNASDRGSGGFDVILGNPPWERVKLQDKEWFASRVPDIANAPNAAKRQSLIKDLARSNPQIFESFQNDRRKAEGESLFVRASRRFPLCGRGDINTYAVFAETIIGLIGNCGRAGFIVPSGIATDETTKRFFHEVIDKNRLISLYDFENRAGLFPAVDGRMRFALLTVAGDAHAAQKNADFVFFAHTVNDLNDADRHFTLTPEDLILINRNSRTCPIFRSKHDAEIAKAIYSLVPVLIDETREADGNPWTLKLTTMFHMTNDAHLLRTRDQFNEREFQLDGNVYRSEHETWMPVIEGKMVGMFDHRAANIALRTENALRQQQPVATSSEDHLDPNFAAQPYLWGPATEGTRRTPPDWKRKWFPVFKRVTASTNERTLIGCIIPWTTVSYTLYTMTCSPEYQLLLPCLLANLCSFVTDYLIRQKTSQSSLPMGVVYETAVFGPELYVRPQSWLGNTALSDWMTQRVVELSYSASDLASFARDFGIDHAPITWDEERRFWIRCELDAAFFHLYGVSRDNVKHIMDSFFTVKRKDESGYGSYRTLESILEIYDRIEAAAASAKSYQSVLSPAPGHALLTQSDESLSRKEVRT